MKKYTHAWLAMKATELLKSYKGRLGPHHDVYLDRFLKFISRFPNTFVRGAWFPDTVIRDNVLGGHTWKYRLDPAGGRSITYRPPSHNTCQSSVAGALNRKVSLNLGTSDLPDRCEALGQTIRDTILITNRVHSGDVVAFNDSQVALLFLMLAHYICDAHVPVHCDDRDFYGPSKIHPDLEAFWEKEIKKHYRVSTKTEQFDLDEQQRLQRRSSDTSFGRSVLSECDDVLEQATWENFGHAKKGWAAFLGRGNKNFWDYLVSVCLVSFHMSVAMFPMTPPAGISYRTVRIMKVPAFKEKVLASSPYILADAINSVAVLWLAAWERWELLKKGVR